MNSFEKSLNDYYIQAYNNIQKIIEKKLSRGNSIHYYRNLQKQILIEIQKLNAHLNDNLPALVDDLYQYNLQMIDSQMVKAGVFGWNATFAQLNTAAIQVTAENVLGKLTKANNRAGRILMDDIRDIGLKITQKKTMEGLTVKETAKALQQALIDKGITVVKDKLGRDIPLKTYSKMVARTTYTEITNIATINRAQDNGRDLVKFSSHPGSCPICTPINGKIYSISGNSDEFPKLPFGQYANMHPQCKHTLSVYIPELHE